MFAKNTKIKFEDGTIKTIKMVVLDVSLPKNFLEEKTGLIYGRGDFYSQTIGILEAWKCCHSPDHEDTSDIIETASFIIAHGLEEKTGGYTVVTDDNVNELLVYVPNEKSPFIIAIDEMMPEILAGNYDYSSFIKSVKIVSGKPSVNDLREQLREAIDREDYELCAKLRNKISKKEQTKKNTLKPFGYKKSK